MWKKYPHIENLTSVRPTPRILLNKKLLWTLKMDGSNIANYCDNGNPQIGSRNQPHASSDLVNQVTSTEDYPNVVKLLKEYPNVICYTESCRKGRSITGRDFYQRAILYLFDVYDCTAEKFLPYVQVVKLGKKYNIPVVELYKETTHRSMKDLLKFSHHVLEYCQELGIEGMVVKPKRPYTIELFGELHYVQAKVRHRPIEPEEKKIGCGEPILPPIPENEILGSIDKVWQDIGTDKFMDTKIAMPLIAKYVAEARRQHEYSKPKSNLFRLYNEYKERLI